MRVAILHDHVPPGARQDEQDVLVQASFVRSCLERLGHEVRAIEVGTDLTPIADALGGQAGPRPEVVFNLFESMLGSGRLIGVVPMLVESRRVPMTGCPAEAIYLTSGKLLTKRWLRAAGLPTADWFQDADLPPAAGPHRPVAPGRWIVKSVWEHASVGLEEDSVLDADSTGPLRAALDRLRARVGGEGFVERFIDGREFNIALLDRASPNDRGAPPEVLPPAEIEFRGYPPERPRVVGFSAKWVEESFAYQHTFRRYDFPPDDQSLLRQLADLSLACWSEFRLAGYARVDFRVDAAGRPWILEVNANPCIAPDAGFMAAAERAALAPDQVIARILRAATLPPCRATGEAFASH